jgi:nitrogenase molybdenum-iron protein beta chain
MNEKFIERPRSFCALGGAALTVGALPGAIAVLHSSMGCGGSIYWNQLGSTGYLGAGYCGGLAVPSSNVQETDIVFGGAERLAEQLKNTLQIVEGGLYVVLTGCMTDIIGDDIQSVVKEYRAAGAPVIGAETGGVRGNGYRGYDLVLTALFRDFVEQKTEKVSNKVNIWGIVPGQDAFWRGNLLQIRSLLEKLGLEVNSFFTEQDTLTAIKHAGDAALNIVVSQIYGREAADKFEEIHGVPYLATALPVGPAATEQFLRKTGEALQLDPGLVHQLIQEETQSYYSYVDRIADAYSDLDFQRYAVVVGDANYAVALTKFLADDLGWLPELTVVTDELNEEEQSQLEQELRQLRSGYQATVVYETDATEIKTAFRQHWPVNRGEQFYDAFSPAFVIGSAWEREFAQAIGAGHLTVSYPVGNRVVIKKGYAGYEGGLNLMEDLFSVIVKDR